MTNAEHIALLHPHFKRLVLLWMDILSKDDEKFGVRITSSYRTAAQQLELWQQGRDENGHIIDAEKVVTKAKTPEQAPHCHRAAIDTVPIIGDKWLWKRLDLFSKMNVAARALQITCGVEWNDNGHYEDPLWRTFPVS